MTPEANPNGSSHNELSSCSRLGRPMRTCRRRRLTVGQTRLTGWSSLLLASAAVINHHEAQLDVAVDREDWGFAAMHSIFWSGHLLASEILALLRDDELAACRDLVERTPARERSAPSNKALAGVFSNTRTFANAANSAYSKAGSATRTSKGSCLATTCDLVAMDEDVIDKYGHVFRGEYGWAHQDLLAAGTEYSGLWERGRRLRGPVFGDLEEAVFQFKGERLWFQLLYAQASAAVHGSHRSFVTITADGDAVIHDGPDLEALASSPAGEATAKRLRDLTWVHVMRDDHRELDNDAVEGDYRLVEAITDIRHRVVDAFGVASSGATE